MNELNSTSMQTPIEIALDIDENNMTTASKLYSFLELSPSNYSKWCKTNITENEFAEENIDFVRFVIKYESGVGIKEREDFKLTAHFAKKLSCKGNGAKAEQAREYFTTIEERVKQKVIDYSQLSPQLQLMNMLVENMSKQELEQKRQAEKLEQQEKHLEKLEQTQNAIADTFQKVDDAEDFQKWANNRIAQIAESPKFDKGYGKKMNYAFARTESYERLKQKRNCRLDDRVEKAVGRAVKERPDIKKSDLQKINKIYIIANDKDLKPAYELVIKEMMVYYCVGGEKKIK